jgi:hypothetical protein
MDVIGFLFVSLGSSTIQLHDSLGSRNACGCSELVSVVKMATVLEECTRLPKSSVLLCVFVGTRTNAKDIHKETFPVHGGECWSRKAVHSWVEIYSQGRSKVADDA